MCMLTPKAITVSFFNKSGTDLGITWQTEKAGSPVLEYTSPDDPDFKKCTRIKGRTGKHIVTYKNYAVIENTVAGQRILYRVGDECGVFSDPAILKVPNNDLYDASFLIFTDTQDGNAPGVFWNAALNDAAHEFPDFGFIVHCGDIVNMTVFPHEWEDMLGKTSEYTRSYPMIVATGNHDYWRGYIGDKIGGFAGHFHIDLPPQSTDNGIYYSVERNNILFVVLSSGDAEETGGCLLDTQYDWAKNELMTSGAKWKIVIIHNPMYSPGKYGSRPSIIRPCLDLRRQLSELFVTSGVDLVLCGHDHMFAVTYPVDASFVPHTDCPTVKGDFANRPIELYVSPECPIHLEPACAGNQNRGIEDEHTEAELSYFREMREMKYGDVAYAAVSAGKDDLKILFRTVRADSGECVFESGFGIRKEEAHGN